MTFPPLEDMKWGQTSTALHQAAMLFGPIHNALRAPRRNYLHLPMHVQPDGLSSGDLPDGAALSLSFSDAASTGAASTGAAFAYRRPSGETLTLPLAGQTQASLFTALLTALKADLLASFFEGVGETPLIDFMMAKLHADTSRIEFLSLEDVTHADPLTVDAGTARDYAAVLYAAFTGVARFRARLEGHMTPVVVWPEHFDLSTLWFLDGAMDDHQEQMNFGFAPFSPGFPKPYLYAYAYPYPPNLTYPTLPAPARWNFKGWTGVVVDYDDIARQPDAAAFIETLCLRIFAALRPLLG